jgi:MFS family permease
MLVSVYPAGRISDHWGRKPLHYLAGFLAASGVLFLYVFRHNYTGILFASALIGFGYGSYLSVNWAMGTDLAGDKEAARYLGLINLTTAAAAAASRLIGPLIDLFNKTREGMGYSVMLMICFISLLLATGLISRIRISDRISVPPS